MKTLYHPTLSVTQDVDEGDVKDWVEQGWLKEAPAGAAAADYDPATASIKQVLAYVGSDKDRAAEALALEQAKGDDARSSLVQQLEKLANKEGSNS